MSFAPSGRQFEIRFGSQRATIVEVGGGIRAYSVGGLDVLEPYAREQMCDAAHGALLIPWPNRIAQGRYSFGGREQQLALSEPTRGNAIHGLLRWRPWLGELDRDGARVLAHTTLRPMSGYPFALELEADYSLGDGGLTVSTSARNVGVDSCPFGAGQHPYLSPGADELIDACVLELPSGTRLTVEERSQVPVGREPVAGGEYDYRGGRALASARLDDAFTDLERDGDGLARARLRRPDGRCVELWADAAYGFLQVFTGDSLPAGRARRGLGLEPMSCAPNAFRSGDGLIALAPGEAFHGSWGVRLLDAA